MDQAKPDIQSIIQENERRIRLINKPYDPLTGVGSPVKRFRLNLDSDNHLLLPEPMQSEQLVEMCMEYDHARQFLHQTFNAKDGYRHNTFKLYLKFLEDITALRIKYDFEFWAFTQVKIADKESGKQIPFKLNRPQRKALKILERFRIQDKPIRLIIDKARQWGGSTLIQIYMDWLQIIHYKGWNSAIVADVEEQARTIRNFQTNLINNYTLSSLNLRNFEGSAKNKEVVERECVISIASMQKPHSLRSKDLKMCHLSEVGFWKESEGRKPRDVIRSIRGTIKPYPGTMIVLESTANGVGNFFHKEWLSAVSGKSAYEPLFVGWHEDERNQMKVKDYADFISTWKDYEWYLWNDVGCTIEAIMWYRYQLDKEYQGDTWSMNSENPTTPDESFRSTGRRYIPPQYITRIDNNYIKEPKWVGDFFPSENLEKECVKDLRFEQVQNGNAFMWAKPDKSINVSNRYVVIVDVGGKTQKADWSVIRVIDRYWLTEGGFPEFVFTWRGHLDADLVAWKALQVATYYNKAMLVIESNYFESKAEEKTEDHSITVINLLSEIYDNLYTRTHPEKIKEGAPIHYGFHMNKQTKPLVYSYLLKYCRVAGFIERDQRAINEYKTLEEDERGRINAVEGCHDDIADTSAIGLYISEEEMDAPRLIEVSGRNRNRGIVSEATM